MALLLIAGTIAQPSLAASKVELDARVKAAIKKLYEKEAAAEELAGRAAGMLVFPNIIKGGLGVAAEVGEGALLVDGKTTQYYRVTSISFGFLAGGQAKSEAILFMDPEALRGFVESDGWEVGVDGSIAVIEFGVGEKIDTHSIKDSIIAFVFSNKGLMYDLSLEGTKFWKIEKE
jgi:lipid-binding SYLF domain-containing protein